ncbi:MAG: hypothetical protein WCI73_06085 [Phycisphaerae bacterium]
MKTGWQGWHHCMVGTYGCWLPGDPRRWCERNHHEDVPRDLLRLPRHRKFAEARLANSRKLMKYPLFRIESGDRERIGALLLDGFRHNKMTVAALAVTATNFHALVHYLGEFPKTMIGYVKTHVTFRFAGIVDEATRERRPLWEGGSLIKPIRNLGHGREVYQYILDHVREGAWVWSHRPKSA